MIMKDSGVEWLGDIPAHWKIIRGKNIFKQRLEKGNAQEILLSATQKYGMYPQNLIEGVVQVEENTDLQTFKTVHKNDYVIISDTIILLNEGIKTLCENDLISNILYGYYNNLGRICNFMYYKKYLETA